MKTFFFLLATSFLALPCYAEDIDDITEAERLFSVYVHAILSEKCFACHGDEDGKIKGGLDMTSLEALLKGGDTSTKVLVPGDPAASLLVTAIKWADEDYEMPPKENDRLTPTQIDKIERWVALGAPWLDSEKRAVYIAENRTKERTEEGIIVKTSGGQSDAWTYRRYQDENLWAFQPVVQRSIPETLHPIDHFVSKKLANSGAEPAPRANARTLIRRITLDLIGLPPTPKEVHQFSKAFAENPDAAVAALTDELLASPHYGERWGQHWLDVVRYADTSGFSNDFERSNAWRYRDYVIRAFNEDKPYDEFILEQVAGDEYKPGDPEALIATGFLRMGPWGTAMIDQAVARQMYLDDLVDNIGQSILSVPLSCCKCHDHKFDPVPTQDYYSIYASFSATQPAELSAPFLEEENRVSFEENKELVHTLYDLAETDRKRVFDKMEKAARAWYAERGKEYLTPAQRRELKDEEKPPRHIGLDHVDEGTMKVRQQDVKIWKRRKERFEPLAQAVYNGPNYFYKGIKLRKTDKAHKWDPKNYILNGGSLDGKGDEVKPGVLSAIAPAAEIPEELDGRRLALAKWMASPENPTTTRSIVNRIWANHFGKGIAATPNNFGAKGAKPTHPELLDWLTADFVANGWKMKRLHKLIISSRVYQQSTHHPDREKLLNEDPENLLLAYRQPRRLTAEELRDSMLAMTGELNPEMGGLPVMPEINQEVALQPRMIQFSIAPAHQPNKKPEQRNRRSIYTYRVRGQADPFLEIFNQPNPNKSCEIRDAASVSPQAFTLLNSDLMTDRSIAFALRLQGEADTVEKQIEHAFHITFGRAPSEQESLRLLAYAASMSAYHARVDPEPVIYPTELERSLVEEFSGKPFEYHEWLPVYRDYTPDKKAADVGVTTRALADVCLVLLNTNEFMYVY